MKNFASRADFGGVGFGGASFHLADEGLQCVAGISARLLRASEARGGGSFGGSGYFSMDGCWCFFFVCKGSSMVGVVRRIDGNVFKLITQVLS